MDKHNVLFYLRAEIDKLGSFHHLEILRIFKKHDVNFSENRNGIFVNMIILSADVIKELEEYIRYVKQQEKQLNTIEDKKKKFKDTFFTNSNEYKKKLAPTSD